MKQISPGIFGVFAMIIASAAILAALIAPASPPSTIPAPPSYLASGIVTAQPSPKQDSTRRPTVCTEQYAPVCGRNNRVLKTYSNACFARVDGADVIAQGPCTGAVIPPGPR
jgi:Kazal-type serine protease inhibitor domain